MRIVETPADAALPGHASKLLARYAADANTAAFGGEPARGAVRRPRGRPARLEDGPADQRRERARARERVRRRGFDAYVVFCFTGGVVGFGLMGACSWVLVL